MKAARTQQADVLIIGSGPSGAVAAKKLAGSGLRVICLEQGDWVDYSMAKAGTPEFELTAGKDWSSIPAVRNSSGDFPIDTSNSDVEPLMWNGVGGSSISWAAAWMRNLPSDFRVRTLDGVGDDWPISYQDLEPCYRQVEVDFVVSGISGDPAYPSGITTPFRPADLTAGGRRIAKTHNELGWHWWPGSNAIATEQHGEMKPCQQLTACMWGCTEGAKASTDLTHWRALIRGGTTLIPNARVLRIETDRQGYSTGAVYADAEGVEYFVGAAAVVVAANAIGTPRLLLSSTSAAHPDGLANSSGLVGKRLMLHPTAVVVGLFDEDLESYRGVWGQAAYSLQFYETDPARDFVRGAKWSLQATGGPLQATRSWPWGNSTDLWGAPFQDEFSRRFGRSMSWGIICEDLPDETNEVVLDPNIVDVSGPGGVKINYATSENSNRMADFMAQRARESFEASGAYRTIISPHARETGWHMLGTAVMGNDPATSVVDRYGRSHDVPNLFVIDGSTWPTSSGMNPTATIAAFALWAADHMLIHGLRTRGNR